MLKLVNNLNEGGHLKTIKELSYEAEEIIFVSPFIYMTSVVFSKV